MMAGRHRDGGIMRMLEVPVVGRFGVPGKSFTGKTP